MKFVDILWAIFDPRAFLRYIAISRLGRRR